MEVGVSSGSLVEQAVDAVIIGVDRDGRLSNEAQAFDAKLDGALSAALEDSDFSGAVGKTMVIPTLGRLPARRLVVTGTGSSNGRRSVDIARAWGRAARAARDAGAKTIASSAPPVDGLDVAAAFRAAVEGVELALYRFLEYRSNNTPKRSVERLTFFDDRPEAESGAQAGRAIARGVTLARDLGNQPGDTLYPAKLAELAQDLAQQYGMECRVYDRVALEEMGAGAIVAVGKGSQREPRLIHLTWSPAGTARGSVALVGKGITFDTGGVNLKSAEGMVTMKIDMAGSAAVLGAMSAVPALNLPFAVHGVIAAAENMPSGSAYRPGDVLTSLEGKTIEITNTDAEGRLVLADALTYTRRQNVDAMIDLATLTGASVVALGQEGTSLFSTDDQLADALLKAAGQNGELLWRMPLWEEYQNLLKGDVADLKNSGGRYGGAIYGAMFLKEFTGDVPWAHLDIAGPAYSRNTGDLHGKGATGHGVRTLLSYLEARAAES